MARYRMKPSVFLLLCVFLLSLVSIESLFGAERGTKITWYRADFPPVTIPDGPRADTGFFDKAMNQIVEQLDGYQHVFAEANFKRIMAELKNSSDVVCCPSLYKTKEREKFIAFSGPAMIVLPNGVISSKKNQEKLSPHIDEDGIISIRSLLQDKKTTLGISSGRKYSGGIDEILREFGGQRNLVVRPGIDVFKGLMAMMQEGRIDSLLGYPIEAEYFLESNNQAGDYIYYPIKESSVEFTIGYVGCSDSPEGRQIIEQVNEIVKRYRDNTFIDYYGTWLNSATKVIHQKMAKKYYQSLGSDQ